MSQTGIKTEKIARLTGTVFQLESCSFWNDRWASSIVCQGAIELKIARHRCRATHSRESYVVLIFLSCIKTLAFPCFFSRSPRLTESAISATDQCHWSAFSRSFKLMNRLAKLLNRQNFAKMPAWSMSREITHLDWRWFQIRKKSVNTFRPSMFFYVLLVFRPCKGIAIRSATGYVALNSPRELQELDDFLCVKSKFKSKFRTERIDTNTDRNTGRNTNRDARMQKNSNDWRVQQLIDQVVSSLVREYSTKSTLC